MKTYSWAKFDSAVKSLSNNIEMGLKIARKDKEEFVIYGNPRGGLCLAVAISHKTGIEMITNVVKAKLKNRIIIWIDDIVDSGDTFKKATLNFPDDTIFVTWLARNTGANQGMLNYPSLIIHEILSIDDAIEWIVFPWEDPTKAKQDQEKYKHERRTT